MRIVFPWSLGVIGLKFIKKCHGEKMAEFDKNKGYSIYIFLSKIVIFWWTIRIKEMQTTSHNSYINLVSMAIKKWPFFNWHKNHVNVIIFRRGLYNPWSLGVIGLKFNKTWQVEKMAEFDKNRKGIAFIFFWWKLSFFDIVIYLVYYLIHGP